MSGPDLNTHETKEWSEDDSYSILFWFRCSRLLLAAWALLLLAAVTARVFYDPYAFHNRWALPPPGWTPVSIASAAFSCFQAGVVLSPVESLHNRGWTPWAVVSVVVSLSWCVFLVVWRMARFDGLPFEVPLWVLSPVLAALATARWASSFRDRGVLPPQSRLRRAVPPVVVVVSALVLGYLNG